MKAPPSMSQFLLLSESRTYNKSLLLLARGTAAINGVPPCRFPPDHACCSVASSRGLPFRATGTGGRCRPVNWDLLREVCSWNTASPPGQRLEAHSGLVGLYSSWHVRLI